MARCRAVIKGKVCGQGQDALDHTHDAFDPAESHKFEPEDAAPAEQLDTEQWLKAHRGLFMKRKYIGFSDDYRVELDEVAMLNAYAAHVTKGLEARLAELEKKL